MKTTSIQHSIKALVLSFFMLTIASTAMAAIPGTWSDWFTIDQVNETLWDVDGNSSATASFRMTPPLEHTVTNPAGCSTTSNYAIYGQYTGNHAGGYNHMIAEVHKLATLAFTAGYQVRVFVRNDACVASRPYVLAIDVKK